MKLSVITSYYNRPKALIKFTDMSETIKRNLNNIEFIIEYFKPGFNKDKFFSTAKCHNQAVNEAHGEWILKQDIDCIADIETYKKIINAIDFYSPKKWYLKWFANFGGINYLGDLGYPQGNQYLCSREAYLAVGGEPEFDGYGCEDYAMLYKLAKYQNPNFKLEYNENNVNEIIRDQLARPLNKLYQSIYFRHLDHEPQSQESRAKFIENKKKLYEICRRLDE